jgi:hypothetical protein
LSSVEMMVLLPLPVRPASRVLPLASPVRVAVIVSARSVESTQPVQATVAVIELPPVNVQSMSPLRKSGSVAADELTVIASPPPAPVWSVPHENLLVVESHKSLLVVALSQSDKPPPDTPSPASALKTRLPVNVPPASGR